MTFKFSGVLKYLSLACILVMIGLGQGKAADELPKTIRIAGEVSFNGGELRLGGVNAVIQQQGWLEDELHKRGVTLEWFATSHAATGPQINEAFAGRQIQFATYGDLPAIILNASGVRTRLVVPNGIAGMDAALIIPENSAATSLEDLKGKRLGIHKGRPWEISLIQLLDVNHLTYNDFQIYNINPQAGVSAVATGSIDALFTTISDAYMLEERHLAKILWSTKGQALSDKTRTELWASADFIDRYPEIAQLVVTAYIKAQAWRSEPENREAVFQNFLRSGTYADNILRRVYDDSVPWAQRYSPLFTPDLNEHYRKMVSLALDKGIIRHAFDSESLLDDRFDIEALKQLGLQNFWKPGPSVASGQ